MGEIDATRFEVIFDDCSGAVFAYLLRRVDRAAAEDALSETFLVAWRRRVDLPTEPLPWLYAVARNVLLNQRKAAGRRAALVHRLGRDRTVDSAASSLANEATTFGPGAPGGHADTHHEGPAMRALHTLARSDREVLLLDAWEQLSSADAALVLGCTPEAYRARLHRAKQRLRRAVGDPGAVPTSSAEATR